MRVTDSGSKIRFQKGFFGHESEGQPIWQTRYPRHNRVPVSAIICNINRILGRPHRP
ncbi:MAG: hypothetical protein OJF58_003964 [Enhydrobacter sp.]|nr:MAG: hypothetical protein OJF58_003964 [Enhydrobacter sp.]